MAAAVRTSPRGIGRAAERWHAADRLRRRLMLDVKQTERNPMTRQVATVAAMIFGLLTAFSYGDTGSLEYRTSATVYFSRTDETDTIEAQISGISCDEAVLTMSIVTSSGEHIFDHAVALGTVIPCDYLNKLPPERVESLTTGY
jgi:hypothetical protein